MKGFLLAFIIALVLAGCVSPPTPLVTITPTPTLITPTPTIVVTATPTPSAQINVSIDFVSCDYSPGAADAVLGRMTKVYANGSASGPVDSYFPIDSAYLVAMDCGEWSNIGSMCVRKAGQPETMRWTHESGPPGTTPKTRTPCPSQSNARNASLG